MEEIVILTEDRIVRRVSDKDRVVCPLCLATNTILDKKCRNCGMRL